MFKVTLFISSCFLYIFFLSAISNRGITFLSFEQCPVSIEITEQKTMEKQYDVKKVSLFSLIKLAL